MTIVAILAVGLVVLKTTVLETLRVWGVFPDLFLALVAYASLFLGPARGLAAGALVGTLVELATAERTGLYPALYGVAGWLAGLGWERMIRRSPVTELLFLATLGFLVDTVLLAAQRGFAHGVPLAVATLVLPSALATGVAGPLLTAAAGRFFLPLHVGIPARVHGRRRPA